MSERQSNATATTELDRVHKSELPDYLQGQHPEGLEDMGKHSALPRIKIVQSQSGKEIQEHHAPGDVILWPESSLIARKSEPFTVVPVFFWPSWQKRRYHLDQSGDWIVDESIDPNSELARRSAIKSLRKEAYPDNPTWFYSYAKSLNYIVEVQSGPCAGVVALLSYSGGDTIVGERLNSYLGRRGTHIYANRIDLSTGLHSNKNGNIWYRLNFEPAKGYPFVSMDRIGGLRELHQGFKERFADLDFAAPAPREDGSVID